MSFTGEIERLVLARKTAAARQLIAQYLFDAAFSHASKIAACGWYRRLGLFREGYLLVLPTEWRATSLTRSPESNLEALWMARFLNLMGATPYAAEILVHLKIVTVEQHRIAGNIWLSASVFDKSLEHFTRARDLDSDSSSYQHRFALLGISDSLSGLGRESEALSSLNLVQAKDEEALLKAVLLTAKGELLCKQKKFKDAAQILKSAQPFFEQIDSSPDYGIYKKWHAYSQAQIGRKVEAQVNFEQALRILKTPDHRPEAWLGIYELMDQSGMLSSDERIYLTCYPGLSQKTMMRRDFPIVLGVKGSSIEIYPDRGEYCERGFQRFGIPLEVHLIQALKCAGPHGVSLVRLKSILWPGEVASFVQLDQRISKLLRRIRRVYGLSTLNHQGMARLDSKSLKKVFVELQMKPCLPRFFEENPEFQAREFADYYGLGKTRSSQLLNELISERRLTRVKQDGKILYRVNLG